jgi:hypothetical protein
MIRRWASRPRISRQRQVRFGTRQFEQKVSMFQQLRMAIAAHWLGFDRTGLFRQLGPPDRARDADPKTSRRGVT